MESKFKQFNLYAPARFKTKAYELNEDGTLTITGVASTTNEDLDGDVVSSSAIQSLQKQAVGLNLHLDHNHEYDGGIGAITNAIVENNQLIITARILSEYAGSIKERLDLGMNFGFSIGGIPVVNTINPQLIEDFILLEISLTLLPANWDTFGTVESEGIVKSNCLTGACHYILKNNSSDIMKKELNDENNPVFTEEEVKEITDIAKDTVNEGFANKEPVIIDEFRDELKPIVQEIINNELAGTVQNIVLQFLDEMFPEEEAEGKATEEEEVESMEVEDETVEGKATDDETVEEPPVDEEVEEKEVDGLPDEDYHTQVNSTVEEKEIPIPEEGADYVTEGAGEEVPTKVTVDEKAIESIVERVFKKLNVRRKVSSKKSNSKYDTYLKSKKTAGKNKFLNSDTRDKFGRNKKYL